MIRSGLILFLALALAGVVITGKVSAAVYTPYTGVSTPAGGASSIGTGGTYTSLAAAIADVTGAGSLTGGPWTFYLLNDLTEPLNLVVGATTNGNSITIRPATATNVVLTLNQSAQHAVAACRTAYCFAVGITKTRTFSNAAATLWYAKTDNFIIDGSNTPGGTTRNLTIQNFAGNFSQTVVGVWGNSDGFQIKNCNITNRATAGGAYFASQARFNGTTTAQGVPDNGLVENCWMRSPSIPLTTFYQPLLSGGASGNTVHQDGWVYRKNNIWTCFRIIFQNSKNFLFEENVVNSNSTFNGSNHCAYMFTSNVADPVTATFNANIFCATISSTNGSSGVSGIYIDDNNLGPNTYTITNNVFSLLNNASAGSTAGGGCKAISVTRDNAPAVNKHNNYVLNVYHNSFYLRSTNSHTTPNAYGSVYAIRLADNFFGTLNFKNNAIQTGFISPSAGNSVGVALAYDVQTNATETISSDYNIVFKQGLTGESIGRRGTGTTAAPTYAQDSTMANWIANTPYDDNSKDGTTILNPLTNYWVSSVDYRLANNPPATWQGTPIATVTTDIDGNPRSLTTPTIGCDENNLLDNAHWPLY